MTDTLTRERREHGLPPLTAEEQAQCNAKVDYMLAAARKAQGREYTALPEQFIPYAEVCVNVAGLRYSKRTVHDWMATFTDWMDAGYQPEQVADAIRAIHKDGKILISRPGSITHRLDAESALKRSKVEDRSRYVTGEYADFVQH